MNIVNCLDRHMGSGGPDDNAAQANHLVASCLQERYGKGPDSDCTQTLIAHTLSSEGHDASEDGTGRGTPIVPVAFHPKASVTQSMNPSEICPTIGTTKEPAIAYQCHGSNVGPMGHLRAGNGNETGGVPFTFVQDGVAETLRPHDGGCNEPGRLGAVVKNAMRVRRLTPRECERLQGFPDDWTRYGADGKEISDSARYRMLGNAVAVPVAQWIGERILEAENTR